MSKKIIFPEPFSLKLHPEYSEQWVKSIIVDNPKILGLGEVIVKDVERNLPRGGRLDLLLQDSESPRRYEIELQLGKTDESHIIRTIEYWDLERKRYSQYDHCAVIVAEEITARFFNVISLFNGHIPLIALQMQAYEINDQVALIFTRILDQTHREDEEESETTEVTDRNYWMGRGTSQTMKIVDELHEIIKSTAPNHELKYNKFYIGLAENGSADNFVIYRAFKKFARIEFRIPKTKETDSVLAEAGFDTVGYDTTWGRLKVDVFESDLKVPAKREALKKIVILAFENR